VLLSRSWMWPSPEAGFALYLFHTTEENVPWSEETPALAGIDRRRVAEGPILATAGFLLAMGFRRDAGFDEVWAQGLERLSERKPFPSDRASFFFRPVELLGITVGTASGNNVRAKEVEWLEKVLAEGESRVDVTDLWTFLITACAAASLSCAWSGRPHFRLDDLTAVELGLLRWAAMTYPDTVSALSLVPGVELLDKFLLEKAVTESLGSLDLATAAVLYLALRSAVLRHITSSYEQNWQVGRESADAQVLLTNLCRRFPLCARQLLVRREQRPTLVIKDEYDVQDLLHALLKLHFDDVRPEEWSPSYGGRKPRMDFLLKREQIVVETKMTRPNLRQEKVIEELIVDKEQYRSHPDCKTLVCFVYDPEGRCSNPTALEHDLSEDAGNFRVIVIVSPRGT
jgi:REase_DpnII-MboI